MTVLPGSRGDVEPSAAYHLHTHQPLSDSFEFIGAIQISLSIYLSIYLHLSFTWLVGAEFNAPLDTVEVISEVVFTANHLTDTDKQNSTQSWTQFLFDAGEVSLHATNTPTGKHIN